MNIALKLLPLYLIIFLGFIAGKKLKVERESIAKLVLYIVTPAVTFRGILNSNISLETFTYPFYFLIIGASIGVSFFWLGKWIFGNKELAGALSLCAGLANVGYYGLPLIFIFFGKEYLGTVMLLILGLAIHECSTAFFTAACGKYSIKEAIIRTLKLPAIYTSSLAFILNLLIKNNYDFLNQQTWYLESINFIENFFDKFIGAYTLLGMLVVGLGLAKVRELKFNKSFISLALIAKFICFPACAIALMWLNNKICHFYNPETLKIIFLMSIVPIGANSITISNELNLDTDLVSITVVISNILALIYIPIFLAFCF